MSSLMGIVAYLCKVQHPTQIDLLKKNIITRAYRTFDTIGQSFNSKFDNFMSILEVSKCSSSYYLFFLFSGHVGQIFFPLQPNLCTTAQFFNSIFFFCAERHVSSNNSFLKKTFMQQQLKVQSIKGKDKRCTSYQNPSQTRTLLQYHHH